MAKRFLVIVLMILLSLSLLGCESKNDAIQIEGLTLSDAFDLEKHKDFIDFGNNVIYFEVTEDYSDDIFSNSRKMYDGWKIGCTSLANINSNGDLIIARNNDNEISEYPIFISKTSYGKYKTFNVYYCSEIDYTYDELIKDGTYEDILPYAYKATDVLNEKGLYIETNMRYAGLDGIANDGTNPGKTRASTMSIPNLVGQNCATVEEAIEYLNDSYDFYTVQSKQYPWLNGWDVGFMIGDANGNHGVIEIANNKIVYTPDASVNANYYLNEEFAKEDICFCGKGRAGIIADKIENVETIDEAISLIEEASWYHEVLNCEYSYKDEDGVHFVDKDGNPTFDYRDELPGTFLVDENGNIVEETGYEEGYEAYLYYACEGDLETAKEYEDDYNMQQEYYGRCTSVFLTNDNNFDQVKQAYLDYFGESKELLLNYFNGDYEPLVENGWVFTTGVRTGVNCMTKEIKIQLFERDDLIISYKFE